MSARRRIVLVELLTADGIELAGDTPDVAVKCFNPNHNDPGKSMLVNVQRGQYSCGGCGFRGNAYSYLSRVKGVRENVIFETLQGMGWSLDKIRNAGKYAYECMEKKLDTDFVLNWVDDIPAYTNKHPLAATHDYLNAEGELVWRIASYGNWGAQKTTRPFVPCSSKGGYWCSGPLNENLPEDDKKTDKYILYRLPELLERLDTSREIWIMDNEKSVDMLVDGGAEQAATCLPMHGQQFTKHNLDPLKGQKLVLIAAASSESRTKMKRLGRELHKYGSAISYQFPDGDNGQGFSDVYGEHGIEDALYWLGQIEKTEHKAAATKGAERAEIVLPPMADTTAFRILGKCDQDVIFQSKRTHDVLTFRASALIGAGALITLAPMSFWQDFTGLQAIDVRVREQIGDALIRAAEERGYFDIMDNLYGRGAARLKSGAVVFNCGSHLLTEDENGLLTKRQALSWAENEGIVFKPGPEIVYEPCHNEKDKKRAKRFLKNFYDALIRYRFQDVVHARVFAGWLITSLIGGALPFRPMIWLQALSGKGKTFLMDEIIERFHYGVAHGTVDTSEAGLVGKMGFDSLPVYLDEFEPETRKEEKWRGLLSLIRMATSGKAERNRGTVTGGLITSRPRFSVMLSSINRPPLEEALMQRIIPIRLSNMGVPDWLDVRKALRNALTEEKVLAMRGLLIAYAGKLIAATERNEEHVIRTQPHSQTREVQIFSSLTVCAGFASGDYGYLSRPEALEADPTEIISYIMGSIANIENKRITIGNALLEAYYLWNGGERCYVGEAGDDKMIKNCKAFGLAMVETEDGKIEIKIAPGAPLLNEIMSRNDHYRNIDLPNAIHNMDGVRIVRAPSGKQERISIGGAQKSAYRLTEDLLNRVGFFESAADIAGQEFVEVVR